MARNTLCPLHVKYKTSRVSSFSTIWQPLPPLNMKYKTLCASYQFTIQDMSCYNTRQLLLKYKTSLVKIQGISC